MGTTTVRQVRIMLRCSCHLHGCPCGFYNSQIPACVLRKLCELDDAGERTLEMAVRRMGLSARAHDRLLKVSRTIAGLGGPASVTAKHVAEAVQHRSLDRNYWS